MFSIVIEELGLIGAGLILALLFFLILRIMIVGVKARNPFNSMMALGVGALMLMQVFVNIGGISGLIPSTGVTFPFLSQGGNSLLVTSVGIAFVLNIAANEKRDNIVQAFFTRIVSPYFFEQLFACVYLISADFPYRRQLFFGLLQ